MLLIDGNNLIGNRIHSAVSLSAARKKLLEELAKFTRIKKKKVTVVFDGVPEINIADGSSYRSVKVFYGGEGSDADTRILKIVENQSNKAILTVVTSDGALIAAVKAYGVKIMKAGAFRNLLQEVEDEKEREDDFQMNDMEKWMRYFGVDETDDEESDE
jgi:predicted RNA-binding protein with PIN domain